MSETIKSSEGMLFEPGQKLSAASFVAPYLASLESFKQLVEGSYHSALLDSEGIVLKLRERSIRTAATVLLGAELLLTSCALNKPIAQAAEVPAATQTAEAPQATEQSTATATTAPTSTSEPEATATVTVAPTEELASNPTSLRSETGRLGTVVPKTHTVQRGENLTRIAEKYGCSLEDLFAINREKIGDDPDVIPVDLELDIPSNVPDGCFSIPPGAVSCSANPESSQEECVQDFPGGLFWRVVPVDSDYCPEENPHGFQTVGFTTECGGCVEEAPPLPMPSQ